MGVVYVLDKRKRARGGGFRYRLGYRVTWIRCVDFVERLGFSFPGQHVTEFMTIKVLPLMLLINESHQRLVV
jgi:hypothetical protein